MNKDQLIQLLKYKGFSERILNAFAKVPRENFILSAYKDYSYKDVALPIGYGATISQPYTIAFMLSLLELKKDMKVLEIGSGSGYVLALISELIGDKREVYGVEIVPELVSRSRKILKNYSNIKIYEASKELGLKEKAPYDRILVSASADELPE
ncbi:MAG: methyltransferase domain-containing protein, partial [Nanoarchaeota archaeon]